MLEASGENFPTKRNKKFKISFKTYAFLVFLGGLEKKQCYEMF